MFIVDSHLDLAFNALRHGRDLLRPVADIREAEAGSKLPNGTATVSFPELREAGVGLAFGTIYVSPAKGRHGGEGGEFSYRTADEAHKIGQRQLDYYQRLADEVDYIRLVGDVTDLEAVVASHDDGAEGLVGLVPLMEGADPIRAPEEAEEWYERGLRIVGLAWDNTRYSGGAWKSSGGLTSDGRRLLEVMADLGLVLDLTHMSEEATLQALDSFEGVIIASHSNARALVPSERQLSDVQIRRIIERGGVVGVVLHNSFLKAGHGHSDPKEGVTLEHVVAHIDHMCQIAGDAAHVGIGSDFDGGFGREEIPAEFDSVVDLKRIAGALREKGYSEEDAADIMGGNWVNLLRRAFG
jgi:membrane dipeptidase